MEPVDNSPSVVKPQDAPPVSQAILDANLGFIRSHLPTLRDAYYWRSDMRATVQKTLDEIRKERLPKNFSGIHSEVCEATTKAQAALKLDKAVSLERKSAILGRKVELLALLEEMNVLELYDKITEDLAAYVKLLADSADVGGKFSVLQQKFDTLKEWCQEGDTRKRNVHQVQELFMLLELAVKIIENKAPKPVENELPPAEDGDGGLVPAVSTNFRDQKLHEDITKLLQDLQEHCATLRAPHPFLEKNLWSKADHDMEDRAIQRRDSHKKTDVEFDFLKKYFYFFSGTRITSWWGGNSTESKIGETMSCRVGQKAYGEQKALKEQLKLQFSATPPANLDEALLVSEALLRKLQSTLENFRPMIAFNSLTEYHLKFMQGCCLAICEAKCLQELSQEFATPLAQSVFQANAALMRSLEHTSSSRIASVAVMEEVCVLFKTSKDINVMKEGENEMLKRIADTVRKVYQKFAEASCVLTQKEEEVWDCVMQQQSLEKYYLSFHENRDHLPVLLQSALYKMIIKSLYVSRTLDSNLELVLYRLRSDRTFKCTKSYSEQFKELIVDYDYEYSSFRRDNLLEPAANLVQRLYELRDSPAHQPLVFAKLYQECIEFSMKPIVGEGEGTREVEKRRDSLSKFLFTELQAFAQDPENGYIDIDPKYRGKLPQDVPPEGVSHKERESYLACLIGLCLYGQDGPEKEAAHVAVCSMCERQEYESFRAGLLDDIKHLLEELAREKILKRRRDLTHFEKELLVDGPITQCLKELQVPIEYNKTLHALYFLMLEESTLEARPITQKFIQHVENKERITLKAFSKAYRRLIVSHSADRAYFAALVPNRNGDGTEQPLTTPEWYDLVNRFGIKEAKKISREATRNALYNERLVGPDRTI